jgi:hypothetical protein
VPQAQKVLSWLCLGLVCATSLPAARPAAAARALGAPARHAAGKRASEPGRCGLCVAAVPPLPVRERITLGRRRPVEPEQAGGAARAPCPGRLPSGDSPGRLFLVRAVSSRSLCSLGRKTSEVVSRVSSRAPHATFELTAQTLAVASGWASSSWTTRRACLAPGRSVARWVTRSRVVLLCGR